MVKMLGNTSNEILKSIDRSRRETSVKIKSLLRLLEALDTVEEVLSRARDRFQASGGQNPSLLTKDFIEPSSLGIHFTYLKDLPLTLSSHLLRKKQTESESELSALQKKQERLEICQGTALIKERQNSQARKEPSTLPKIEEGQLCTPKIRLGKVCRDKNGLFRLTEEYTYMGEEEVMNGTTKSPTLNPKGEQSFRKTEAKNKSESKSIRDLPNDTSDTVTSQQKQYGSDSKSKEGDRMYSDLIDFDVMEKLDGMDPKTRGDYTAQFYRDLFEESEWLLSAQKKQNPPKAMLSVEKNDRYSEQSVVSIKEGSRERKKGRDVFSRPSSDLARLFTGKKKDRSHTVRERKLQTQKAVQCQERSKDHLLLKNQSKRVTQGTQQQPGILHEDVAFSPLMAEILDPSKHNAVDGNKQLKEKFSKYQHKEHEMEPGMATR